MQEVLNVSRDMLLDSEYIQLTKEFINFGFRPQGMSPDLSSIVIQLESYVSDGTRYGSGGGNANGLLCNNPSDYIETEDDPPKIIRVSSPESKVNDGFFIQFNCINSELDRALELANMVTLTIMRSTVEGVTYTIQDKGILYDVDGFNCYVTTKATVDMSVLYANDYTDAESFPIPHSVSWNLDTPAWYPGVFYYDISFLRDINGNQLNPDDYELSIPRYYFQIDDDSKTDNAPASFFANIVEEGKLQINTNENSGVGIEHQYMKYPFRYVFDVDVQHKSHEEAYARITTQVFLDWSVWDYPPVVGTSVFSENPGPDPKFYADDLNPIGVWAMHEGGGNTSSYKENPETGEDFQFLSLQSQSAQLYLMDNFIYYYAGTVDLTITSSPPAIGAVNSSQNRWDGTLDLSGYSIEQFFGYKFKIRYTVDYIDHEGNTVLNKLVENELKIEPE